MSHNKDLDPLPVNPALITGCAADERRVRAAIDARLAASKAQGVPLPKIKSNPIRSVCGEQVDVRRFAPKRPRLRVRKSPL